MIVFICDIVIRSGLGKCSCRTRDAFRCSRIQRGTVEREPGAIRGLHQGCVSEHSKMAGWHHVGYYVSEAFSSQMMLIIRPSIADEVLMPKSSLRQGPHYIMTWASPKANTRHTSLSLLDFNYYSRPRNPTAAHSPLEQTLR